MKNVNVTDIYCNGKGLSFESFILLLAEYVYSMISFMLGGQRVTAW